MDSMFLLLTAALARAATFGAALEMASFSVDLTVCRPTCPCQHKVVVDGRQEWWGARRIVDALESRHQPVPDHFLYIKQDHAGGLMALLGTHAGKQK